MPSRRSFIAGSAAFAAALSGDPVRAQGARTLTVSSFSTASTWPLWVGVERGFFAQQGLDVRLVTTPSSVALFKALAAGEVQIAQSSIDNAVAYDEGQGEVPLDARDFVAFMGVDGGLLRLVARDGIASIADLRGKKVMVDALSTGFAFVLYKLLKSAGLAQTDVQLVAGSGTPLRWKALQAGLVDATLLTPPFDLQANDMGMRTLAAAEDLLGPYQGLVNFARRGVVAARLDDVIAYVRGYLAALRWMRSEQGRSAAVALLGERTQLPTTLAARVADAVLGKGGLTTDGAIDMAGLRTVLALRSQYASARAPLDDPAKYVDDAPRKRALA